MPELPEVETVRRGIAPLVTGRRVTGIVVRRGDLRWPVPVADLERSLPGRTIREVTRRGKYLLFGLGESDGWLLLHLGMSGVLRFLAPSPPPIPGRHDHVDILLSAGLLRLTDPRRFGALLWCPESPSQHPLLHHLGPEPLSDDFDGSHLYRRSRGRRLAVKNLIMDGRVVVGVGNIYAAEALFRAGLHPALAADALSQTACHRLAAAVRAVLAEAIGQGGTTLRDFQRADGRPGYFRQALRVYGRAGQPCPGCGTLLATVRLGGRASVFCPHCQPEKPDRRFQPGGGYGRLQGA